MSRDGATEHLADKPHGTFLVRMSVVASRKGEYAMSIKSVALGRTVIKPPITDASTSWH